MSSNKSPDSSNRSFSEDLTSAVETLIINDPAMQPNPARVKQLIENINRVSDSIRKANTHNKKIRLVAVSKLKPITDILALCMPSHSEEFSSITTKSQPSIQFHFGENYFQELLEKSQLLTSLYNSSSPPPCESRVKWHFIGAMQTNKARKLASSVHDLWCVESVDTEKKASELNKGRAERVGKQQEEEESASRRALEMQEPGQNGERPAAKVTGQQDRDDKLRVMVQVNTSGEEEKAGVWVDDKVAESNDVYSPDINVKHVVALCTHIRQSCPHLHLQGLMTIGAIARSQESRALGGENEDFTRLRAVRDTVAKELGIESGELELSMGMSEDFESAIRCGSDEVRVGSTIFGERPAKKDAKVMEEV